MQTELIIFDTHPLFAQGIRSIVSNHKLVSSIKIVTKINTIKKFLSTNNDLIIIYSINSPIAVEYDVIKTLIDLNKNIKVICSGSFYNLEIIKLLQQIGCYGYFQNSSNETTILNTIELVIQGKKFFNIEIDEKDQTDKSVSLKSFTKKEIIILQYISEGFSTKEIANKLNLSISSIDFTKRGLFAKTNTKNIGGLVNYAHKNKLI